MSEKQTRIINGVEYRYCGNHGDPKKVPDHYRVMLSHDQHMRPNGLQEALEHEKIWLKDAVLLAPEPTEAYTVEELKEKFNSVSVWKPEATLAPWPEKEPA